MIQPSEICYQLIRKFEGFRASLYRCPGGYWTIGYGHVLTSFASYPSGISIKEAEMVLEQDVAKAANAVDYLLPLLFNQNEYDALVSFTFNVGSGALQRSTLRQMLLRGEREKVPWQWRRWIYAGGKKQAGLIRRREEELALFVKS